MLDLQRLACQCYIIMKSKQQHPKKQASTTKIEEEHKQRSAEKSKEKKGLSLLKKEAPKQPQNTSIVGKPWSELQIEIRQEILDSLAKNNFTTMFPVQQAAIPLLLKNYDLAVEAQTGSGKTLSFLIPLLQKYLTLNDPFKTQENDEFNISKIKVKYLLISPTRELVQQSYHTLQRLLERLPDKERSKTYRRYCHCATGGSEIEEDIKKMQEGVYVLMGTVGRLKELGLKMEPDWLKKVEYLFIDEADRVLKEKGIEELIKSIQKIRRTAMFSATLQGMQPKNFQFYGMRNLAKISLKAIDNSTKSQKPQASKGYVIPKSLHNTYISMSDRLEKMQFLLNFLQDNMGKAKIIIFFSTCACVDYYLKILQAYFKGRECIFGIHGKLKSKRRKRIIEDFLERDSGALLATDVVSRGIDFEHIHFILQVDPPEDPDNYIHRIGRTARVNRPGTAILLIENHEQAFITYLQGKGVGVEKSTKDKFTKCETPVELITERVYEIICSDRDNVEKAKRAFVSYIRAYKEHDLKYIFEFKNVDIGMIAHSFFLFRIPRVKEILGKSFASFTQSEIDIEAIPWLDKNQEMQFQAKQEHRDEERRARDAVKQSTSTKDIKNIKSQRKKVRRRNQAKEMQILNKEHKAVLKDRNHSKGTRMDEEEDDYDEDTEQIEQKIQDRNN